jgi:hypothetical protein
VQCGLTAVGTLCTAILAFALGAAAGVPDAGLPALARGIAVEGAVLAGVQVLALVLLLVAAIRALRLRSAGARTLLVAALGGHAALALYWLVRLSVLAGRLPSDAGTALGAVRGYVLLFAALPLVALGLVVLGPARRWFAPDAPRLR